MMINYLKKNNIVFSNNYVYLIDKFFDTKPALLICSNFYKKTEDYFNLVNFLKNRSELKIIENVPSNPSSEFINKILEDLKKYNFKNIIAIGGGSVIDVSKIVKISNLNYKEKFLLVIPSTAGTGSEVTNFATVWDYKNNKKLSFENKKMKPNLIIFNSKILYTHDFRGILFPVLDSISHCLESIWNKNSTLQTEKIALRVLQNYIKLLPNINNYKNYTFIKKLQWNSFLAGCIIAHTKTSIAHAISYPLTLNYSIPHGLACSFSLPVLIDYYNHKKNKSTNCFNTLNEIKDLLNYLKLGEILNEYINNTQLINCLNLPLDENRIKNFCLDKNEAIKCIQQELSYR